MKTVAIVAKYNEQVTNLKKLLKEKGFDEIEVRKMIDTFMAVDATEKLKGTKWEKLH